MSDIIITTGTQAVTAPSPFEHVFEGTPIRHTLDEKGEPWFVAADVCAALGIGKPENAYSRIRDTQKGTRSIGTLGGQQMLMCVNEAGMYSLIMKSRKPSAEKFQDWVAEEVLPSIRKTGQYQMQAPMTEEEKIAIGYQAALAKVEQQKKQIEVMAPKATFYDSMVSHDGLYGLQVAAKILTVKPKLFIRYLKAHYLFYRGKALVARQEYLSRGIFETKIHEIADKERPQTYITPKGLQHFEALLSKGEFDGIRV